MLSISVARSSDMVLSLQMTHFNVVALLSELVRSGNMMLSLYTTHFNIMELLLKMVHSNLLVLSGLLIHSEALVLFLVRDSLFGYGAFSNRGSFKRIGALSGFDSL
jgi:hypothetical protein